MSDLAKILEPKSDQLNAEDLVLGDKTITITEVILKVNAAERKITIRFDGDNGKPWYPCKTVGRTLAHAYGGETKSWVGKTIVLFRNPEVIYAGKKEGGIRIRAMTDIRPSVLDDNGVMRIAVMETRGARRQLSIRMMDAPAHSPSIPQINPDMVKSGEEAASYGEESYRQWFSDVGKEARKWLTEEGHHDRMKGMIFQAQGRTDEQHGDQFDDTQSDQPPAVSSASQQEDEACHADGSQEEADAGAASDTDETPVYQAMIDGWKARLDAPHTVTDISSIRSEFDKNAWGLPDEVNAEIDGLLTTAAYKFTLGE